MYKELRRRQNRLLPNLDGVMFEVRQNSIPDELVQSVTRKVKGAEDVEGERLDLGGMGTSGDVPRCAVWEIPLRCSERPEGVTSEDEGDAIEETI
jgi:hypothetical protein